MLKETSVGLLFIFAFSAIGFAQQDLAGKTIKRGGTEILIGVTVINLNQKKSNTRLTGDSLQLFLRRYRPSYKFCRKANSEDILLYINDKLVLFRKGSQLPPKPH
jgi:hypothetical protein